MTGWRIASVTLLLLLDGAALCATEPFEKVGLQHNNVTTFPRGVRNMGMGGTGAADLSGFSSGYFNPASLASGDAVALSASMNDWMEIYDYFDTRVSAGFPLERTLWGAGLRLGGSLAYAARSADLEICDRTIYNPQGTYCIEADDPDYCLSGSFAVKAEKGPWELSMGGTAKYLENKTFVPYTTWAFDLGLIAAADIGQSNGYRLRPRLGGSIRNLGSDIEWSSGALATGPGSIDQPEERRYGIGIDVSMPPVGDVTEKLHRAVPAIGVSIDYDVVKGNGSNLADGWAFGAEVSLFDLVRLRAGRSEDVFYGTDCTTYGAGLGWDFGRVLARIDYARIDPSCNLCQWLDVRPEVDAFGLVVGGRF